MAGALCGFCGPHAGRATEATEIASLARYLASEEAASITGQAINVSGGLVMH